MVDILYSCLCILLSMTLYSVTISLVYILSSHRQKSNTYSCTFSMNLCCCAFQSFTYSIIISLDFTRRFRQVKLNICFSKLPASCDPIFSLQPFTLFSCLQALIFSSFHQRTQSDYTVSIPFSFVGIIL